MKINSLYPLFLASIFIIVLFSNFGCQGNTRKIPIIIMGVDGLDWDVILPMLNEKRLPNLANLMHEGYYGYLQTFTPTSSPIIWTSIATGKVPQKHGINSFTRRLPDGRVTLMNNTDRKTKAIWNILSDYGRNVSSIGWWMTYPVEDINGVMVAQTNTIDQLDLSAGKQILKGTLIKNKKGQVYPPDRQNEIISILAEVDNELPDLTKDIFGEFNFPMTVLDWRLWKNCQWSFRADATYQRVALTLAKERVKPDLLLLYFGGPDVVGHRFWRYMRPELYQHKPTARQITNLGHVIEDYYAYMDKALGQLIKAYGPDFTIFIISDHGMKPFNQDKEFNPNIPPEDIKSGNHLDAPPAFFLAFGPHIRKLPVNKPLQSLTLQDLKVVCSVLDITPTILAMLRIPIGTDMDGKVVKKIFRNDLQISDQPPAVATHDTSEYLANHVNKFVDRSNEKERLDQLQSLGYIGNTY